MMENKDFDLEGWVKLNEEIDNACFGDLIQSSDNLNNNNGEVL